MTTTPAETTEAEATPKVCSTPNCGKPVYSKGLCRKEYDAQREQNNPVCSVDGCERKSYVTGKCRKHYVSGRTHAASAGLSVEDREVLVEVVEKLARYNKKSPAVAKAREILGIQVEGN